MGGYWQTTHITSAGRTVPCHASETTKTVTCPPGDGTHRFTVTSKEIEPQTLNQVSWEDGTGLGMVLYVPCDRIGAFLEHEDRAIQT